MKEPKQAGPRRYHALDSLRGICAVMVCLFHFHSAGWLSGNALSRHSDLFVDFFFVLSGFVIAVSYRTRLAGGMRLSTFMALRLGRIYPVHLVVLSLFAVAECLLLASGKPAFGGGQSPGLLVASLLLVQIFVSVQSFVWNGPSWSIAAEIWTYLIYAIVFRLKSDRQLLAICGASAVCAAAVAGRMSIAATLPPPLSAFAGCVYGFGLGAMAVFVARSGEKVRDGFWQTLEPMVVVSVVLFVSFGRATGREILAPLVFAAAVIVFAQEKGAISRALLARPLIGLGKLSYCVYMVHLLVQYRITGAIRRVAAASHGALVTSTVDNALYLGGNPLACDTVTLLMLAVVLCAASVMRFAVEVPSERWVRRRLPDATGRRVEHAAQEAAAF